MDSNIVCPHCGRNISVDPNTNYIATGLTVFCATCPNPKCSKDIISISAHYEGEKIVYPFNKVCHLDTSIPEPYYTDFQEAYSILELSPKASAAISRRLLQHLLRDELEIKPQKLNKEIEDTKSKVPEYIYDKLDTLREMGNDSAHVNRNEHTNEIIEIEDGEAEYCLDTIQDLFDFLFVGKAKSEARKQIWESKREKPQTE